MNIRIYALLAGNAVFNIIQTDESGWPEGIEITDLAPRPSIGWTYDEATGFAPPQPDDEPAPPESSPPPARRIVTNLAFDLRFSTDERVAIELAAADDPAASIEQRTRAAYLRVSQERAKKAMFIDLGDPVTRDGVLMMEQDGLLAEGRALEILDSPIVAGEIPWDV